MRSQMIPVSALVLTLNEEASISACLESIVNWAGEVFVVDSGSTDRTLDIVSEYTENIVHHPFENYSCQRNWAQEELPLSYDWVFHIDADERVSDDLRNEIRKAFANGLERQFGGFMVRRRIVFMGRWIKHGGLYPTYHLRLFHRDWGRCEDKEYDQHFILRGGRVGSLEADLIEDTASSLDSWTERHRRWAALEARHLVGPTSEGAASRVQPKFTGSPMERRRWLRSSIYERAPLFLRALGYFFYRFVLRGGFLDGPEGLIYHVLQGFWFRFYTDACVYELRKYHSDEL